MDSLDIRITVKGDAPEQGLVVSNHLSYLDILIYGAIMPCFFVAKSEIGRWPFFGTMARAGGTLFVERSSKSSAMSVNRQIAERLSLPVPILFFPEGTSTDGSKLLRFHSRLFEPGIAMAAPVTAAAIRYVIDDRASNNIQERDLCWFGDDALLPHMWKVLNAPAFHAEVHFGEPRSYSDRRIAAECTHTEIVNMRTVNS